MDPKQVQQQEEEQHHDQQQPQAPTPLAPPSIPPRPARSKTPTTAAPSVATPAHAQVPGSGPINRTNAEAIPPAPQHAAAALPIIPPRPARVKSPQSAQASIAELSSTTSQLSSPTTTTAAAAAPLELPARPQPAIDENIHLSSDAHEPQFQELIASIPSDMQVHAPVAVTSNLPSSRPPVLRSMGSGTTTPGSIPRSATKSTFETGIPQIGRRVPMYPNAGDVQAPTPTPSAQATIGKKLSRASSPKEDYGEYGAGLHPLERRSGHYSLSREDLNQIVAQTAKTPEVGTLGGIPDEELGWQASEEYTRKIALSPSLDGAGDLNLDGSFTPRPSHSPERSTSREESRSPEINIHVEPSLRHARSGSHPYGRHNHRFNQSSTSISEHKGHVAGGDTAQGSVADDDEYGHKRGEFRDEIHYSGTPILASDEVTKRHTATPHMDPAISPVLAPRRPASRNRDAAPFVSASSPAGPVGDSLEGSFSPLALVDEHEPLFPPSDDEGEGKERSESPDMPKRPRHLVDPKSKSSSKRFPSNDIWEEAPASSQLIATVASRPPSREGKNKNKTEGEEDREEAPDAEEEIDEETAKLVGGKRAKDHKLTRPSMKESSSSASGRRFPSKDIWEEAPESSQLTATVSPAGSVKDDDEMSSPVVTQPAVQLPGMGIVKKRAATDAGLEDNNASTDRASTGAPLEDTSDKSSIPARPVGGVALPIMPTARPSPRARHASTEDTTTNASSSPSSVSPIEKKIPPTLPERPKQLPTIPQRPARISASSRPTPADAAEQTQLQAAQSSPASSPAKSTPPALKPKPSVPPRVGGKIAALKANLNLENRLAAGPMGFMKKKEEVEEEKKEEQEEVKEKEPVLVADVRKGRTKGPRGRKLPTAVSTETKDNEGVKKEEVSVSAPATPPTVAAAPSMGFAMAWTVWSVDEGEPEVVLAEEESKPALPASFEAPPLQEEAAIMGDKGESKSTQEHLAKEVLTEMVDPPAVVHSPGIPTKLPSQEEKTEKKEEVSGPASSGLVKEDSHPEDAAPKGESKLDPEEPAHHPRQAEEKREEERDVITTKEEGEWDVVSKE